MPVLSFSLMANKNEKLKLLCRTSLRNTYFWRKKKTEILAVVFEQMAESSSFHQRAAHNSLNLSLSAVEIHQ
jgi:hypothetical protein